MAACLWCCAVERAVTPLVAEEGEDQLGQAVRMTLTACLHMVLLTLFVV